MKFKVYLSKPALDLKFDLILGGLFLVVPLLLFPPDDFDSFVELKKGVLSLVFFDEVPIFELEGQLDLLHEFKINNVKIKTIYLYIIYFLVV